MEIRDYLVIFLKRKWLILEVFLSVFIIGTITTFSRPKVYEARAAIMIQKEPTIIAASPTQEKQSSGLGSPEISLETHCLFLTSRRLANLTAEALKEKNITITPSEIVESLRASVDNKAEGVIIISAKHRDPVWAKEICNATAIRYRAFNQNLSQSKDQSTGDYIAQELKNVQKSLNKIEDQLREFKERNRIYDAENNASRIIEQVSNYSSTIRDINLQIAEQEALLQALRQQIKQESPYLTVQVENPLIADLRKQLTQARLELTTQQTQWTDEHPSIRRKKNEIRELEIQLRQSEKEMPRVNQEIENPVRASLMAKAIEVQATLMGLKGRLRELQELFPSQQQQLKSLPAQQAKLGDLTLKKQVYQTFYNSLLDRQLTHDINKAGKTGSVTIVDEAATPEKPISPQPRKTLPIALALGLFAGLGLAFLLEYLDDTIHSPDDVQRYIGLTTLGIIPYMQEERPLVTVTHPKAPLSEAYRTLRSNLKFTHLDHPAKTLLITSASAGEGKSVTAANLAVVLAQTGKSVILVDTDLRRPVLHKIFGLDNTAGVTSILAGEQSVEDTLQPTEIEGLRLLASGPLPPNPAELLESQRMGNLVAELSDLADIVLFDTPPAIVVTDAAILAAQLDGILLVTEAGRVSRQLIRQAKLIFERAQANILGVVLNKLRLDRSGYYHYYYYYYYYYGEGERRRRR